MTDITEHLLIEGTVAACGVVDVNRRKTAGSAIDRSAETTLVDRVLYIAWPTRGTQQGSIVYDDSGQIHPLGVL